MRRFDRPRSLTTEIIFAVAAVAVCLTSLSGCVPTPNENAAVPPEVGDLRTLFFPQTNNHIYLWKTINSASSGTPADTLYSIEYLDPSPSKTSEGYSPVWQFKSADTLRRDSAIDELYIS